MTMKMVYWEDDGWLVGRLIDYPNVATQAETLEELEENIKDAFELMYLEDVPANHKFKEVVI